MNEYDLSKNFDWKLPKTPEHLTFLIGDTEIIKFEESGDVYIRGEKVDSNKEIYEQMRGWLLEMRCPECKKVLK